MDKTLAIRNLSSIASGSAARLKGAGRLLWRFLSFSPADELISPKRNLCISIEKAGASIAYGSRVLSRIKVNGVRRHTFEGAGYPHPDELASAAALTMNEPGAAGKEISLCIPKAWAIMTTAELPSVVRENLSEVISYELDRLTPFSAEEAYYDFIVTHENNGKLSVLLVAARADMINAYLGALREKGLTVNRVTVNLSAIGSLWRSLEKNGKDSVFIEVHEEGYEGALFIDGSITESFAGTFSGAEEKAKTDAVMTEVESYRSKAKQQGRDPQLLLLFGETGSTLREMLKLRSTAPTILLNETDIRIKLPGAPKEIPYAAVGGMFESLSPKAGGVNLLSRGRHETPKTPFGLTVALALSLAALLLIYTIAPLRVEGRRLAEIDRQIALRKDEVKKVEALRKEIDELNTDINTIMNFKEGRPKTLDIVKELTAILPKTTWLTRVRVTETTVEIEGYASSATELLPKLEASKLFKKAEFASPTFRDARMNSDRFIIKMEIEGIKKPEGEGPKNAKK